jgi:hypothetical protein
MNERTLGQAVVDALAAWERFNASEGEEFPGLQSAMKRLAQAAGRSLDQSLMGTAENDAA